MARRLDEAPRVGGLYYLTDGTAVDANGVPLDGAPKRPDDTKPEDQPYAQLVAATTVGAAGVRGAAPMDFKALGAAIADGLTQAAGRAQANADASQTAAERHDELTDSARDAKPKEGAAAIVPGSATAEAGQAAPRGVEPPPDGGSPDTPSSNKTGGGSKPAGAES
jgi:hypothetical protein